MSQLLPVNPYGQSHSVAGAADITHRPRQAECALSQELAEAVHVAPNQPSLHIHLKDEVKSLKN